MKGENEFESSKNDCRKKEEMANGSLDLRRFAAGKNDLKTGWSLLN